MEVRTIQKRSLELLAKVINVATDMLLICRDLIDSGEAYYEWETPKKSGGVRKITSPKEEVKEVQKAILHQLLYRIPIHHIAHGFCRGRGIKSNALEHRRARSVLNIDLKDAFPRTRERRVAANLKIHLFPMLRMHFRRSITSEQMDDILHMIVKICTYNGSIPQGAPTSPAILNIVCINLDAQLYLLGEENGLTVTRYADDITFSTEQDDISGKVKDAVYSILYKTGWMPNRKKTQLLRRRTGRQLEVTGLIIQPNGSVRVPLDKRKRYADFLAGLLENDELDPKDRASAIGVIAFFEYVNGRLPSAIAKKWRAVKEKFGIEDRTAPKYSAQINQYNPDIPTPRKD